MSGYDAGKKIKGRKRHIVVDTLGFMVGLMFIAPTSRIAMVQPQSSKQSSTAGLGSDISVIPNVDEIGVNC